MRELPLNHPSLTLLSWPAGLRSTVGILWSSPEAYLTTSRFANDCLAWATSHLMLGDQKTTISDKDRYHNLVVPSTGLASLSVYSQYFIRPLVPGTSRAEPDALLDSNT